MFSRSRLTFRPVGASLLAMTAAHPAMMCLTHRYREQAHSHRVCGVSESSNTKKGLHLQALFYVFELSTAYVPGPGIRGIAFPAND